MRFTKLFMLFLLLPAMYLMYLDVARMAVTGKPFTLSSIGQVWAEHHSDSFEKYKDSFRDPTLSLRQQEENWNTKARVYLERKALPFALILPGLYALCLFFLWMLGLGPYRVDSMGGKAQLSPYARLSRRDNGPQPIRYRRP
jgi:hypothetical protein